MASLRAKLVCKPKNLKNDQERIARKRDLSARKAKRKAF
jgi:hypothetical protein